MIIHGNNSLVALECYRRQVWVDKVEMSRLEAKRAEITYTIFILAVPTMIDYTIM